MRIVHIPVGEYWLPGQASARMRVSQSCIIVLYVIAAVCVVTDCSIRCAQPTHEVRRPYVCSLQYVYIVT